MKEEIKEILDKMNDLSWYEVKDTTGTKWIELKLDDTDKLVHYIINLEQENSEQLDENLKLSEWLVKKQRRIEKVREYINKVRPKMFKHHNKPAIYILSDIEKIIGDKDDKNEEL